MKSKKVKWWRIAWMLVLSATSSSGQTLPTHPSKLLIREMFSEVIENMHLEKPVLEKYFSKEYVQWVDGKSLNYNDFVRHMRALKGAMKSLKVTFRHLIVEGDTVATVHIVEGEKKNGKKIKAQVNAIFQIRDGKLVHCDELTHLSEGDKEDKDLGSRE